MLGAFVAFLEVLVDESAYSGKRSTPLLQAVSSQ